MDIDKIRNEKPIKELLNFSILNIDKPAGPTSFSVSSYIRREVGVSKTSHFGTLDPQVSGVLPVGLGRACKLSDYFMHKDKTYVGIMRLHEEVPEKKLKEALKEFIGKISQLPPVRSRVKRAVREREIKTFDILEIDGKDVLFETQVQAGTYIRKLIHDMGEKLGGAHMLELRRTKAGIFEEPSYSLYDLDKAVDLYKKGDEKELRKLLIPAEIVSQVVPSLQVKSAADIKKILTGKPLMKKDVDASKLNVDEKFVLFNKDIFIGAYRAVSEGDIVARPEFVFN